MDSAIEARLGRRGGLLQRHANEQSVATQRSVLAARLVELWSWGVISSPMVQWLAAGALADLETTGAPAALKDDVAKLSRIGSDGEWAGNTRRDLLQTAMPQVMLFEPLSIRVSFVGTRSRQAQVQFTTSSVLLPNELFESLYLHYRPFFERYVVKGVQEFWGNIRADDPFACGHPVFERPDYATAAVPYMVLGDKVQYTDDGDSIHCLAWSPLLATGLTWQRNLLLAIFPAACCCKQHVHGISTMKVFWDYICLGFSALAQGAHPARGPYGDLWPAGSRQEALAGKPIAGGSVWGILGRIRRSRVRCFGVGRSPLEFKCALSPLPRVADGH